jgi:hypothetical protein
MTCFQPLVDHNRGSAEAPVQRTFDKVKEALKGKEGHAHGYA